MNLDINISDAELPPINSEVLKKWIEEVAALHGFKAGNITYVFTNDEAILKVNREFLQHDYYTDIITFDYSRRRIIHGDLFISLDTVATNAELIGESYIAELQRVIIHGILHLCGINDKGPGERAIMERHENEALSLLKSNLFT